MKALLKNQKYIVAIFLTTLLFIGTFSAGYIQAQNVGEPITLEIVPVSERTPQVRDAIVAAVPDVDAAADVTETHLAGITALSLNGRNITSLKSGDFDGLTGLEELLLYGNQLTSLPADIFSGLSSLRTLRFGLNQITSLPDGLFDGLTTLTDLRMIGNQLTSLPDGIFEGLTGLTQLRLGSNAVNPLPLTVSLEKVADGQFKAVAPTGAPFDIVLPLNVTNGTISGGTTTITIPAGSVESETLTMTRIPGIIWSVTVDIGTLPNLPGGHAGYTLVKSDDLSLAFPELGGAVVIPVCDRNPAVIQAIDLRALFDPNVCSDITEADLAAIEFLSIDIAKQPLKVGDFDGLSALTVITIERSQGLTISEGAISNLPALTQIWIETSDNAIISEGAISNLPALTDIWIETSQGVTISEGAFSNLPALTTVRLEGNRLTVLPEGIFSGLTSLTTLDLGSNELTSLPDGIFEGLTALTTLNLTHNNLTTLPEGIFSDLTALISLNLRGNQLTALPKGIFNGLSSLTTLQFEYNRNELTTLPDGIFEGLTSITKLWMYGGTNTSLPLNVSLEKVGDNQFKAVAPSGAPFDIVLLLNVPNGTINGGATTITIPAGSVESETLTVTRTIGTSGAVSVWIESLPSLPVNHFGYRLINNTKRFNRLIIFEDISEQVWSGTVTGGSWGNDFGNGNATGYGYSRHRNAGSISNPNFTYRGTTYTIHGISISRIGNNLTHQFSLLISPRFPACDKQVLAIGSFRLSEAGEGNAYGASWYLWRERSATAWPVGHQYTWVIALHPTVPDAPVVATINEGNQVMLSWTTPCDGGTDITGHEYRQRIGSGTFGPWIPIPNSATGEANSTSYTVTNVSNPLESTFEVRAVNQLGPSLPSNVAYPVSLGFIPVSERTPQVRDAIVAAVPGVNSADGVTAAHLAAIKHLYFQLQNIKHLKTGDFDGLTALTSLNLAQTQLSTLPADIFEGLTSLTWIRLDNNQLVSLPADLFEGLTALENIQLHSNQLSSLPSDLFEGLTSLTYLTLSNNRLSSLPDGIFEGLTALRTVRLVGNAVDPVPLTVFVEKVADGQFKVVVPTGAPFEIVLPLTVTNGSLSGGVTTITIPVGSVESEVLTVTRTPGTTSAVAVDVGQLPTPPRTAFGSPGYALVKSDDLPLTIITDVSEQQPAPKPDLVVEAVQVVPSTVDPGQRFRLYATLKNNGTEESAATTIRYYRSTDDIISTEDTQLGRASRNPLAANDSIRRDLTVTVPTTPGTYYYGVCVDSVPNESDTTNNCSAAVSLTVQQPPTVSTPSHLLMYWTDRSTAKIQRANLDGSNVEDLVTRTQGLREPYGITLDVAGGKMYWTDKGTAKIQRANLDGSNVEDLVTQGLESPLSIALDMAGGKMYWTDFDTDTIQRANLDGSNIEDLVTKRLLYGPRSIVLDVTSGKMYWIDLTLDKIQRANLDGSNVEDLVTQGLETPLGIALDVVSGKMYWTDRGYWEDIGTGKIQRANLDGSNVEDLVTQGLDDPDGIALNVANGKMYWTDWGTDKIQRANLDGSNVEDLVTGLQHPSYIALGIPAHTPTTTTNNAPAFTEGNSTTRSIAEKSAADTNIGDVISATDADSSDTLTYTLGGTDAASFGIVSTSGQLQTNAPLDYETKTSYMVTVTVSDGNKGNDSIDVTINITDVDDAAENDPPVFTEGTNTTRAIAENTAAGEKIGDPVSATDADNDVLTYSLGGTDAASFSIDSTTGQLQTSAELDYETKTSYTVTVSVSDVDAGRDSIVVTINITDIDEDTQSPITVSDITCSGREIGPNFFTANISGTLTANQRVRITNIIGYINEVRIGNNPIFKTLNVGETFTLNVSGFWHHDGSASQVCALEVEYQTFGVPSAPSAPSVPLNTTLLPNYPNPFNPETWIPYHLANDSDVLFSIYDINGALVRELDLGHQRAGYYTDRSRTAYWDGRNEFGERVPSGVYFYQLRTGDYSQMRKMVILK